MTENTKIEWCTILHDDGTVIGGHTWNPWRGCAHAKLADGSTHPGCDHCYAERTAPRNPKMLGLWGEVGEGGTRVGAVPATIEAPIRWAANAAKIGKPVMVFVNSLSDFFEDADLLHPIRDAAYAVMDHPLCRRWVRFVILTKRPQNIQKLWSPRRGMSVPFPGMPGALGQPMASVETKPFRENVGIGVSVSDQKTANELIPALLHLAAGLSPCHIVSAEPLIGEIDFQRLASANFEGYELDCVNGRLRGTITRDICDAPSIDWLIVGGESGHQATVRPMPKNAALLAMAQARAAHVPFMFKQWGEWIPVDDRDVKLHHITKLADRAVIDGRSYTVDSGRLTFRQENWYARVGTMLAGRKLIAAGYHEHPDWAKR